MGDSFFLRLSPTHTHTHTHISIIMRTSFLFLLAFACTSHAQLTGCGSPDAAPVLNGVDIVATFAQAKAGTPTAPPVMGSSTFNHTDSEGFVFHFSSADNAAAY